MSGLAFHEKAKPLFEIFQSLGQVCPAISIAELKIAATVDF